MDNPIDPKCIEAFLWMYGPCLDLDEVTELMDITPTSTHKTEDTSQWFLSSVRSVESDDPLKHIEWVMNQVRGKEEFLKRLQDRGYSTVLYCKMTCTGMQSCVLLTPELMKEISQSGLLFQAELTHTAAVMKR
jgi:hypothetical protein